MNILYIPGLRGRTLEVSDQDTTGAPYNWYGFLTNDGAWTIMREDRTSDPVVLYRYAAVTNNGAYASYASAWAARASLTYDYFNKITP